MRVIPAATAIMNVVFDSFIPEDDRISELLGVGPATAPLDATHVEMILLPSAVELLGDGNRWLPKCSVRPTAIPRATPGDTMVG